MDLRNILVLCLCIFATNAWAQQQPNVLFIAVDDLRPQINAYGESLMKTPNLDRLAKESITFQNAYCQQAICMASRASILSGIRPEHRQIYSCGSLEALAPEVITMNELFSQNGYLVEAIGKIYHHGIDHKTQFGEKWHDPKGKWVGRGYITDEAIAEVEVNKKFNPSKKEKGPAYEMADVPDNQYIDGANTDYAISRLASFKKSNKPFFLAMGFHKPHLPWCAPKKYWDMYSVDELELSNMPDLPTNLTRYSLTNWGELRGYLGIPQGKDQVSDELAIQLRWAYYACVSYIDAQLGRILDTLEQQGLAEHTIIVLWGDHGFKLGDHQAWSKHTNFEIDTRVPLIIKVPDAKNKGASTTSFAELVDLYPTLCDLTGLDKPAHLEGESLVPIIENPKAEIHDAAFHIFPRNRTDESKTITGFSIRTKAYRYIEWIHLASGSILASELYDHRVDNFENENQIDNPEYAEEIEALSKKLHQKFDNAIPGLSIQPEVVLYEPANLLFAKQQYQQKKEPYVSLVDKLINQAEELLEVTPYSVMQKKKIPPSKDKHDYYSMGIYWWPNPDTKDGLPYIRKDGKKNPEYDDYDGSNLHRMSNAIFTLGQAYFYTEKDQYAQKASDMIDTWFLNPATKMNPHLEYGQAIPGITEGRGIGIIETGQFLKVITAIGLLKGAKSWTTDKQTQFKQWIADYNEWMVTSQNGWDERMWHNNHGSSYDSQVIRFGLFAGQDSIAREILDSVMIKRIDRQIQPDGSQPWELERTKAMSYSIKNLLHLMENAILAEKFGEDLWNYESADGRSIRKAIRFLIPFMMGEQAFPYTQYGGLESQMKNFKELIWIANQYLEDELIQKTAQKFQQEGPLSIQLRYPAVNGTISVSPK